MALIFHIKNYQFVLRECEICLLWFLFCIVFIFKNNYLIYVHVSICLLVDCSRTTKLDIYRLKKMFGKIARFRPFFTLASIFFLYEHFRHKFLFKSYKEKHYFRYSYQVNFDLTSPIL